MQRQSTVGRRRSAKPIKLSGPCHVVVCSDVGVVHDAPERNGRI